MVGMEEDSVYMTKSSYLKSNCVVKMYKSKESTRSGGI